MSLIRAVFQRRKSAEPVFDPNPPETDVVPLRPYRVLHADLPFFSDPDCRIEVPGARLIVVQSEDPAQAQHPIEALPVRKRYRKNQIVHWEFNNKKMWDAAWYVNPETGAKERAWRGAVEFVGQVVRRPAGGVPGRNVH